MNSLLEVTTRERI